MLALTKPNNGNRIYRSSAVTDMGIHSVIQFKAISKRQYLGMSIWDKQNWPIFHMMNPNFDIIRLLQS